MAPQVIGLGSGNNAATPGPPAGDGPSLSAAYTVTIYGGEGPLSAATKAYQAGLPHPTSLLGRRDQPMVSGANQSCAIKRRHPMTGFAGCNWRPRACWRRAWPNRLPSRRSGG